MTGNSQDKEGTGLLRELLGLSFLTLELHLTWPLKKPEGIQAANTCGSFFIKDNKRVKVSPSLFLDQGQQLVSGEVCPQELYQARPRALGLCYRIHNPPPNFMAANTSASSFQSHQLTGQFYSTQYWLGLLPRHNHQCDFLQVSGTLSTWTQVLKGLVSFPLCLLASGFFSLHTTSPARTIARSL